MQLYVGVLVGVLGLLIIVAGVQSRGFELYTALTGQAVPGQHVHIGKTKTPTAATDGLPA